MTEPTYLWNWSRTRRHIDSGHGSLCGQVHRTRDWHSARLAARNLDPQAQREALAKLDEVPVCQHCLRIQAAS